MSSWVYIEIVLLVIFICFLYIKKERVSFTLSWLLLGLFSSVLLLWTIYNGNYDVFKIYILFFFIYVGFTIPKYSVLCLLLVIIFYSITNILFSGYNNKTDQINLIFILPLYYIYNNNWLFKKTNKDKLIFALFFVIDFFQSYYFQSRTGVIFSVLVLVFIFMPRRLTKFYCYFLISSPFIYIIFMVTYFKFYGFGFDLSISNVERSSMVMWCVDNINNYWFKGPGVNNFIDGASLYMYGDLLRETPNDPHSVFLKIFVSSGTIIMLIIIYLLLKLILMSVKNNLNLDLFVIFLVIILGVSMGTFSADTRIIVGLSLGILLYYSKKHNIYRT